MTSPSGSAGECDDFLAPILAPAVKPTLEVVVDELRVGRRYRDEDFPMDPEAFAGFRRDIVGGLEGALGLKEWAVRRPLSKNSPLAGRFRDQVLDTIEEHGVCMEVHLIESAETGERVPAVLCLPSEKTPRPGICVFSGHSPHGLRDMVVDLTSYQRGIATRLAQAGFASIAVEKLDAGYLSRTFPSGVDEPEIATHRLYWGGVTRGRQLMACLAASEILAGHPRVDETRIGATGVSLGGWLSVQTALLSDRIGAVADFGMKTVSITADTTADSYQGMKDLCHIIPGMLSICDRNLIPLAYAPRPMLAGHGRRDASSHGQHEAHYRRLCEAQYDALTARDHYEYHIHDSGDTMPEAAVIEYFRRRFGTEG